MTTAINTAKDADPGLPDVHVPDPDRRPQLELLSHAVAREAHILAHEPWCLASHLHNMIALGEDGAAEPLLARARAALDGRAWLRLANRPRIVAGRQAALRTFVVAGGSSDIAWSPDAQLLAGAGTQNATVWDPRSGEVVERLEGSIGPIAWSPDGAQLASSQGDHSLRLRDRTGGTSAVMAGHTDDIRCLAWSPDGSRLASGGDDHTVRVWERSGTPVAVMTDHTAQVLSLAWSPDGSLLASGSDDDTLRLWTPDGAPVTVLEDRMSRVLAVAWSPDGSHLATAGWDGMVRVWDRDGWDVGAALEHGQGWTLAWSPDGSLLAFGSADTVRVWDARTRSVEPDIAGHAGQVHALAWSPGGEMLASGSADGTVRLWDRDGATQGLLTGHLNWVTELAWSPDGSILASGSLDDSVRLWDPSAAGGAEGLGSLGEVHAVAWSPDGSLLASGANDRTVRLWATPDASGAAVLEGHAGEIRAVAWSPDGGCLASIGSSPFSDEGHVIRLWERDGTPRAALEGHTKPVSDLCWSPDGSLLASAGGDGSVRLWTAAGEGLGVAPVGSDTQVLVISWCPDGTRLAFGDAAGRIWVLRAVGSRFEPDADRQAHSGRVFGLSWSPDGTLLASASDDDQTVRLWGLDGTLHAEIDIGEEDADSLHRHSTILTHKLGVRIAWSPDSRVLATASMDPVLRLWDTQGVLLAELTGHNEQIWAIAWLPGGAGVVSGGADNTVRIWDIGTGECSVIARTLSPVVALRVDADGRAVRVADDGTATARQPIPYVFEMCNVVADAPPRRRVAPEETRTEPPEPLRAPEPSTAPEPLSIPVSSPIPTLTLASLLAASGLKSQEFGGAHVMRFAAERTGPLEILARELPDGVLGLYLGLPEVRRKKDRAYHNLLEVSFEACYTKAFLQDSGALVLAAEVPLATLSPDTFAGVCNGLAAMGDLNRDDLTADRGLRAQLAAAAYAQACRISLAPEHETEAVEAMLAAARWPFRRGGSGVITTISLMGNDLNCLVRPLPTCLSFIVGLGGVRPSGEQKLGRLLALNRSDVAKVGLDSDGDVVLLYEVPALYDGLLDHLVLQFTPLLLGAMLAR